MDWLLSAGQRRWIPGLVARLAIAAIFIPAGVGKFANHADYVARFDRWGIGPNGTLVTLTGLAEVGAGVLLLLGLVPRLGALTVVGVMATAIATAGRVDGGRDVWLPAILIVLALIVLARGAGPARLAAPWDRAAR